MRQPLHSEMPVSGRGAAESLVECGQFGVPADEQ